MPENERAAAIDRAAAEGWTVRQARQEVRMLKAAQIARAEQAMPSGKYRVSCADPLGFVISLNLHRRHLSESQRAMVAASIATLAQGKPANLPDKPMTQAEAAAMLNVSRRTVQAAVKVRDDASPELKQAVMSGKASLSAALSRPILRT